MYQKLFYYLSLTVWLTGCATQRDNIMLNKACMERPSSILIAQISGLEKPNYYKVGAQGLLDIAITEAMGEDLEEKLKKINVQPVIKEYYYQPFDKSFSEQCFKVIHRSRPLTEQELLKAPIDEKNYAPYDFRPLKKQYGVEYALLLHPRMFGLHRRYYGFIPLGSPKGYVDLAIYLVKLKDNSLEGYHNAKINLSAEGEWDSPPDYEPLMQAVKKSLIKALEDTHAYFFITDAGP